MIDYNKIIAARRMAGISGSQDVMFPSAATGGTKTTLPIHPPMARPEFTFQPSVGAMPALEMPAMPEAPKLELPAAPGTEGGPPLPVMERPQMGKAEFKAPEWSEQEISRIAQKRAAPGMRGLREGLREMAATTSANDPVARANQRQALKGFGAGLSEVQAGAHSEAVKEYSQKYGYEFQSAAMQFEAEADAIARKYQGDLAMNMAKYEAELQSVMVAHQTKVQGATIEHQAAFSRMMRQYELESQAAMLKYETGARRQEIEADLRFKAAALDYQALMEDYMAQYGEETTITEGAGEIGGGQFPAWKPPQGYPGWVQARFNEATTRQRDARNPWAGYTGARMTAPQWPTARENIARRAASLTL